MKWFWYSLIGFCILMCSCKTQKSAHLINEASKENIQTGWIQFQALTDTTRVFRILLDKSKFSIIETIKITEYDKESGKPIKETDAKRKVAQDTDQVVAEEGNQAVTECNQLKEEHFRDTTKMMESEVEEESIGGQESFGKWFGIVLGISVVIIGVIIYICIKRKFRVSNIV